mgnify:CR=1
MKGFLFLFLGNLGTFFTPDARGYPHGFYKDGGGAKSIYAPLFCRYQFLPLLPFVPSMAIEHSPSYSFFQKEGV